jgi:replication factor C subunit 1
VEKLAKWLRAFPKSLKTNFKLGGADGSGTYRAVIIHGPPGIGKTTAAHLVAKLEGYDIVENNASDTRSKKLMEESLKGVLSTTSLLGYFAGDGKRVEESKKKLVLIMDEVDGMSAGDRGGVGALAAVCKKTRVPIILICNDRKLPKMKPFDFVTYDLPFRRPTTDMIRSRIMTILYREQLNIPLNVVNALIEGTNADIRQVVNMISTAKLNEEELNFQSGKDMSKAWQKHVILKPWDITSRILGGGMFSANSSSSLSDKVELYFNDHEMAYLMLQENYLGTQPILANSYEGHEKRLKQLELVDKAAQSISDGDLVDRLIHGSQQQWSLMPTHAVFSFVRPASFISGSQAGSQTRFTSWLGNNSKLGKLNRMVKEIQGHMRLRSSGDRHEVRQQYIPTLWNMMPKRLEVEGKEAVQPVIDLMDSYFLAKDDLDAISELGVGPMDMEKYLKIEPQVKSTFTRLYDSPFPSKHALD